MSVDHRAALCLAGLIAIALAPSAQASVTVTVEDSCNETNLASNDFTARAIVPPANASQCEIRWSSPLNPVNGRATVNLYFGQPGVVAELTKEPIAFNPDGEGTFVAVRRFSKQEMGTQSFVTVLVASNNEILQWTAWTLRSTKLPTEPPPASNLSLDVRLAALHLENTRGQFPRSRQAEGVVWKAVGEENVGYELDGAETGSPGLHVVVSNSWAPSDLSPTSIKQAIVARTQQVALISSHEVKFGDLKWIETLPETILFEDGTSEFQRKHFYTVITIWTDASYRPVGRRNPQRYVHETSATIWPSREVTEWASYVRSEFTADPRLLALVDDYTKRGKAIPGFGEIPSMRGGDAGSSTYSLRFLSRLRPWAANGIEPDNDARFAAGIESFAIVGTRAGVGTAQLIQESEDKRVLCTAFQLFCPDKAAATAELPKGWSREAASAHLTSGEGNVPIVQTQPQLAVDYASRGALTQTLIEKLTAQYRGVLQGDVEFGTRENAGVLTDESGNTLELRSQLPELTLSQLPARAYFVLGAKLSAGALIRKDGFVSTSYRMIPVNSYVQYVIRTSAIKDRATLLTNAPTREVPDPVRLGVDQRVDQPQSFLQRIWDSFKALPGFLRAVIVGLVLVAILAVMWFLAPLRPIVTALGSLAGALIRTIVSVLQSIARLLRRKDPPNSK